MIRIRPGTEEDWALLRDVRLAALRDAPEAFGSTHAREAAFVASTWRERAARPNRLEERMILDLDAADAL